MLTHFVIDDGKVATRETKFYWVDLCPTYELAKSRCDELNTELLWKF